MHDPNNPVFETTDTGCHVAGTGLPRLEAASRSGARARSRGGSLLNGWGWWDMIGRRPRRRPRAGDSRGPRADPYAGEEGPGRVSRLARLRMDLWGYGAGNTKDAYGTEADVRAISESNQHWAGFKLRVLTQNLWGIPVISRCLEARVHAFAKTLGGGWDVIALQEVWHARERDALRRAALAAGLRYSRHFEHGCGAPLLGPGMGGTGLLILSRFPITESFFRRFSANGQPYQLQHSDYLGGKGLGLARLHTPAGAVDLYVSHLHGDYSRAKGSKDPDRYKSHRVAQAFEVAHIIRLTSRSPLVLLLSDLNAGPGSMPYGLQRSVAGLLDAFGEAKPDQDGFTCEATDNVFSNGRDPPARLDYVLFKALPPPLCAPQAVEPTWELSKCWVHRAHIPEDDTDASLLAQVAETRTESRNSRNNASTGAPQQRGRTGGPAAAAALSSPLMGSSSSSSSSSSRDSQPRGQGRAAAASPVRSEDGNFVDGVGAGLGGAGVAAEFTARDPEGGDDDDHSSLDDDIDGMPPPRRGLRHSQSIPGGTFPQGPLLARALTEIDRGIEEASNRRTCHLRTAKALATLWLALLAGGAVAKSDGLMGYIARGAAGVFGGVLCTAASALFLLYWFSAKQEVQGLKEVFQTATNYERHLPMEEAFPDGGFDTSQLYSYMEQHFR